MRSPRTGTPACFAAFWRAEMVFFHHTMFSPKYVSSFSSFWKFLTKSASSFHRLDSVVGYGSRKHGHRPWWLRYGKNGDARRSLALAAERLPCTCERIQPWLSVALFSMHSQLRMNLSQFLDTICSVSPVTTPYLPLAVDSEPGRSQKSSSFPSSKLSFRSRDSKGRSWGSWSFRCLGNAAEWNVSENFLLALFSYLRTQVNSRYCSSKWFVVSGSCSGFFRRASEIL
mmetsp:Transcript_4252/g.6674  ORF Transcript_4252/g.6674 Transcript_4252/m.6674 type:complete len:228 (-) Transcript_4252:9759-10442(-)